MTDTEQGDIEQGARCVTGSLMPSRCERCFRARADVTQYQVERRVSTWLCPACAIKEGCR